VEEIASGGEASMGGTGNQNERRRWSAEGYDYNRHELHAGCCVRMLLGQLRLAVRGHD